MRSKRPTKTNAIRLLDRLKISYQLRAYDASDQALDGHTVALRTGLDPTMVYKTLIAQDSQRMLYVFVIPVTGTLDLKSAARAAKVKSLGMIPKAELLPRVGYVHGGCSPLGQKKASPTWIDSAAQKLEQIAVSAGAIGLQMILSPSDLAKASNANWADLTTL